MSQLSQLQSAVYNGDFDRTMELLMNGEDINAKDGAGMTPLHCAAYYNNIDIMYLILFFNSSTIFNKSNMGYTALHCALFGKSSNAVKVLLEHGADMYAKANNGVRPIDFPTTTEILKLFNEYKSTLDIKEPESR